MDGSRAGWCVCFFGGGGHISTTGDPGAAAVGYRWSVFCVWLTDICLYQSIRVHTMLTEHTIYQRGHSLQLCPGDNKVQQRGGGRELLNG
jgi:hypothetical protein